MGSEMCIRDSISTISSLLGIYSSRNSSLFGSMNNKLLDILGCFFLRNQDTPAAVAAVVVAAATLYMSNSKKIAVPYSLR